MSPYASVPHVEALNSARTFTANSRPTKDDVVEFLDQTAARIDGVLRERGYLVPVATPPGAVALLRHHNAVGAYAMAERSAVNSPHRDAAWEQWMACLGELRRDEVELDAPTDDAKAALMVGVGSSMP